MLQRWYTEGGKVGHAPVDIHVFEAALRFKVSPDEVRKHPPDVLQVADIMNKKPAEVATWHRRDRAHLIVTHTAQTAAAPELERRAAQRNR